MAVIDEYGVVHGAVAEVPMPGERVCPRCAEMIKAAAVVCKHCGWKEASSWSTSKKVVLTAVAVVIVLIIWGASTGPKTYQQLAERYTRECIDAKGDGSWLASDGDTLEDHCKLEGAMRASAQARHDHPEAN